MTLGLTNGTGHGDGPRRIQHSHGVPPEQDPCLPSQKTIRLTDVPAYASLKLVQAAELVDLNVFKTGGS